MTALALNGTLRMRNRLIRSALAVGLVCSSCVPPRHLQPAASVPEVSLPAVPEGCVGVFQVRTRAARAGQADVQHLQGRLEPEFDGSSCGLLLVGGAAFWNMRVSPAMNGQDASCLVPGYGVLRLVATGRPPDLYALIRQDSARRIAGCDAEAEGTADPR